MNNLMSEPKGSESCRSSDRIQSDAQWSRQESGSTLPLPPLYPRDGASVAVPCDNNDVQLPKFFAAVEEVKAYLAGIQDVQQGIIKDHDASLAATRRRDIVAFRARMQAGVKDVNKQALVIKKRLQLLEADNKAAKLQPKCGEGSSSARIRLVTIMALRQKLAELMSEFQALHDRIKAEHKNIVARRIYAITGQDPDLEHVDKIIETGNTENIFKHAIRQDGQVQHTVVEIQERHDAVKDLERSLVTLHEIFLDMAVLVNEQGNELDNIEYQVSQARDYVEYGVNALVDAKRMNKSSRKCKAVIFSAGTLVVVLTIAIILWTLLRGHNSSTT